MRVGIPKSSTTALGTSPGDLVIPAKMDHSEAQKQKGREFVVTHKQGPILRKYRPQDPIIPQWLLFMLKRRFLTQFQVVLASVCLPRPFPH